MHEIMYIYIAYVNIYALFFTSNATDNVTLYLQLRRVVNIQGKEEVAFENLAAQLGLEEDFARQVVFDIKVKEATTGRIQNVTATYNMYRHKYA